MYYLKHTLFLLALCFISFSCSKENEAPSTSSIIGQGKWRVILFSDNGAIETDNYTGYEFTFSKNGTVTAVKGSSQVTGTWNTGGDETENKFNLNLSSLALSELNKNWSFTRKSYTSLTMEHVSSGSTGTDILVLERL